MTCIVAVTDGKRVVLGGDSAGVGGNELRLRASPKVFRTGSWAVGFTTSFRMGQILQYETPFPEPAIDLPPDEMERFIVTELIPAVRRSFAEHGFAKTVRTSPSGEASVTEEGQAAGGIFLIGVAGQIFEVRQDFYLARPTTPYSAVGAAASVALGALHALESQADLSLEKRAEAALEAAMAYSSSVREPFHFVEAS